ncbi:PLP-dependent aminotransferase family protein [Blastococcus sp. KM273128]|uniref:MocR-like pyridoxine biosynthesis transcription factor PdxR n=1 Tax=Blastococcus sp. KM273128 TaxID=2570314 RepID=UPI001F2B2B90|nr:PLP-dependent aminotransferase family protein [Blastococcus sp. KM273128]MCF6743057.1 PLP-dependent aminotransferase family protein [Blastococcus sp. KM273128]
MAVAWGRDGPDLLVTLDRGAGGLGVQLQDQLRAAIRGRRLGAGERLPSTRRLAERLGVSRGTVVEAYEQLLAEGYLESAAGSGTRVAATPAPGSPRPARSEAGPLPRPVEVDFRYGLPDLASVPLTAWSRAVAEAARTVPTADLGDEDPAGSRHLREVVTAYHRRVRAGCAVAGDAVVVSGFRQGLTFTLAVLARRGVRHIGLEDPGPREHEALARRAGLVPVPVPVDDDGLDVDRLRASGARAVLLTPAHQCPTGVALGPSRRRDLVTWAEEVDGVVLEDDYDAEFRYDRQPVGSLQGLAPNRVVALGSVSKTLAPAIRLGWVLAPPHLVAAIAEEKRLSCRDAPRLDQEALALLVESGRFDRHLRRVREVYRARRDVLVAEVEHAFGVGRLTGLAAGCHAVLRLPEGASERAVAAAAAARGVLVDGLSSYRCGDAGTDEHPPALVLAFGNVREQQIRRGVRVLADVVRGGGHDRPAQTHRAVPDRSRTAPGLLCRADRI